MKNIFAIALVSLGVSAATAPTPADAQEPYVGQIMLVGESFCPRGYTEAAGQLLAISQNDALFSLFGTMYGGDGRTTFGLPDMRGRLPVTTGTGPGLSNYRQGSKGGVERQTLTVNNLPSHSHTGEMVGSTAGVDSGSPAGALLANGIVAYSNLAGPGDTLAAGTITVENSGGSQPIGMIQPVLALRYCVALVGIYPSRS